MASRSIPVGAQPRAAAARRAGEATRALEHREARDARAEMGRMRAIAGFGAGLLVLFSLACGGPRPSAEPERRGEDDREPTSGEEAPRADARSLAADASFAQLLDAARTLDDRRDQESAAGCLLRRPGRGWRLEADLAVAVRPLPAAPDDLDGALASEAGPVNVLSRWGAYGPGDPAAPSFAAVTTTLPPRREPALVWAITERGAYVRSSAAAARELDPIPVARLGATLPSASAVGALFVTAEAGTPLSRLTEALAAIPAELSGRVGLAVPLAAGTRLPAAPRAEEGDASAGACPNGLSELPESAPEGDLRPDVIVQSLGPLRQAAATCVSATQGPGAAGGRVALALRIGPDGRVHEACAVRDETNDPALRECLVRAARAVAFPAPSPPGFLDVELPLALAPLESQRQAPLCP